jgi:putative PIN family toxin of toxin-antitoxin system
MTRVVFDCMVFLQAAARSSGPAAACLQAVRDGKIELVISAEILAEIRDVLTRPRTARKFPSLTVEAVDLFVQDIESLAVSVSDVPLAMVLERDPKDEPYLNLAIASSAAYLTTWDNDLLDLMSVDEFRQRFPVLTILEPPALLRALETKGVEAPEPEGPDFP